MPHEINRMMYVGAEPWHGLGIRLPKNATYDQIADIFYEVRERPVYVPGRADALPDVKALVRSDTGDCLAVVGKRYEVVQIKEVAKTLVEAASGVKAIFHTAGLLGANGARFWLLGELPNPITVRGDPSEIRRYILGTAAHDCSTPVTILNAATRVVCSNTLGVALAEKTGARWIIRHTRSAPERLREAARGFREVVLGYERFSQLANLMARTRFSDAQLRAANDIVLPIPTDESDHARLEAARSNVIKLFEAGRGMNGIRGTAWAAWQAFTEYADHHRPVRGAGDNAGAKRLESIWFGGAADLKRRALVAITEAAKISMAA